MLKTRNLFVLAAVLVVLLAVKVVQDRRHETATARPGVATVVPGPLNADDLQQIVVDFGREPEVLVLSHQPDGWVVATAWNARANPERVNSLVEGLSDLTGEYRSDNADVLADYGFTDSTTVAIRGRDRAGGEAFAVEVGRKPARAAGQFVRRPGENTVYLASKPVLSNLGLYGETPERPRPRQFLDLQAYQTDRQAIDAITVTDAGKSFTLRKEFPQTLATPADTAAGVATDVPAVPAEPDRSVWEWRLHDGRDSAAVKTKADALLGAVASLRASDVVDPDADPATYGLEQPGRQVVVELQGGETVTLSFGAARAAQEGQAAGTYLRVEGNPTVWVMGDYAVKNIFKAPADLLPEKS